MSYVYMLKCAGNTLYTGYTEDPGQRMLEHFGKSPKAAKFTKSHPPKEIAGMWEVEDRSAALKTEAAIKGLTRPEKESLILEPERLREILEAHAKGRKDYLFLDHAKVVPSDFLAELTEVVESETHPLCGPSSGRKDDNRT